MKEIADSYAAGKAWIRVLELNHELENVKPTNKARIRRREKILRKISVLKVALITHTLTK